MKITVRQADATDLLRLRQLEEACFDPQRRASASALRRSLAGGPRQIVRVIDAPPDAEPRLLGAAILWVHPRTLRVYSVAVHPDCQGSGLGHILMADAEAMAVSLGIARISLEADQGNERLINWYLRQGFAVRDILPDYYAPGRHAVRMTKAVTATPRGAGERGPQGAG